MPIPFVLGSAIMGGIGGLLLENFRRQQAQQQQQQRGEMLQNIIRMATQGGTGPNIVGALSGQGGRSQTGGAQTGGVSSALPSPGASSTVQAPQFQGQPPVTSIPQPQNQPQGPSPLAGMRQRRQQRSDAQAQATQQAGPLSGGATQARQLQAAPQQGQQGQQAQPQQQGMTGSNFLGRPLVPPPGFVSYEDLVGTLSSSVDIRTDGTLEGTDITIGGGKVEFLDPITRVIDGQIVEITIARDVNSGEEAIHSIVPAKETIETRQIIANSTGLPLDHPLVTFQAPLFGRLSPEEQSEALQQFQAGNVDALVPANRVIQVPRGTSAVEASGMPQPQGVSPESLRTGESITQEQGGTPMSRRMALRQPGATAQIPSIGDVPVSQITDIASQILKERGGKAPSGPELERMVMERLQQAQSLEVQPQPAEPTAQTEPQGIGAIREQARQSGMNQLIQKETAQVLVREQGKIANNLGRSQIVIGRLDDVIDKFAAVKFPSSTAQATIRRMLAGSGLMDTLLTSFSELGEARTSEIMHNLEPVDVNAISGITQEERDAIAALNFLIVDLRSFSGEARPTDFDALRALKALGQEFGTSPGRAVNQMVTTFNGLVRTYNMEASRLTPQFKRGFNLPESFEERQTPKQFRAPSQGERKPRQQPQGGVLPKLRQGSSGLPGRSVNPNELVD